MSSNDITLAASEEIALPDTEQNLASDDALVLAPVDPNQPQQQIGLGQGGFVLVGTTNNGISPQQNVFVSTIEAGGTKDQPVKINVVTTVSIVMDQDQVPALADINGNGDAAGIANLKTAKIDRNQRHPCYPFGFSRNQGARCWASINLFVVLVDFIVTFYHLLYVTESVGMTEGYMKYFEIFHAMECPTAVEIDIIITYVGSVISTVAAVVLFCGANLFGDKTIQINLSAWYTRVVLIPLFFTLQRFAIALIARGKDHKEGGPCDIQAGGSAATNFWLVNILLLGLMIVWHVFGFLVAMSFIKWLKMPENEQKIEETKHENEMLDELVAEESEQNNS